MELALSPVVQLFAALTPGNHVEPRQRRVEVSLEASRAPRHPNADAEPPILLQGPTISRIDLPIPSFDQPGRGGEPPQFSAADSVPKGCSVLSG